MADELRELNGGTSTVVLKPARLSLLREAVGRFVQTREQAEWLREEDREALALLRELTGRWRRSAPRPHAPRCRTRAAIAQLDCAPTSQGGSREAG